LVSSCWDHLAIEQFSCGAHGFRSAYPAIAFGMTKAVFVSAIRMASIGNRDGRTARNAAGAKNASLTPGWSKTVWTDELFWSNSSETI
jgi:hypothetical protein